MPNETETCYTCSSFSRREGLCLGRDIGEATAVCMHAPACDDWKPSLEYRKVVALERLAGCVGASSYKGGKDELHVWDSSRDQ